jgi:hypothetical protein
LSEYWKELEVRKLLDREKSSLDFSAVEILKRVDAENSSDSAKSREHCKESELTRELEK